jgi:predicted acylesterase/phospholipase RssA
MVAGSGIGSLMAAGIAYVKPGRSDEALADPSTILDFFEQAEFLFSTRIRSASGHMIHDSATFDAFLKQQFGPGRLVAEAASHVVFPAFDLARRVPVTFSDLDPVTSKFFLWQALRGVCAVPRFLTPALVENRADSRPRGTPLIPIVGAGRYADDPALAAYAQGRKLGWDRDVMLVSIGSGVDVSPIPYFHAHGNHGLAMTDVTGPLLSSADDLHSPIANHMNLLMNGDPKAMNGVATRVTPENRDRLSYFRVNGKLEAASGAPDDISAENLAALRVDGARIVRENSALLDEIVRRLATDAETAAPERIGSDSDDPDDTPGPSLSRTLAPRDQKSGRFAMTPGFSFEGW